MLKQAKIQFQPAVQTIFGQGQKDIGKICKEITNFIAVVML
jgi:hypothetical protein